MSRRVVIVSADGHAGAPPEIYLDYIEPKFRGSIATLLVPENDVFHLLVPRWDSVATTVLDIVDQDHRVRDGGERGEWDWSRRLAELDHEGVAGEVISYGVCGSVPSFFSSFNNPYPADLRAAGAKAFHRFLADGIADAGGRLRGVAEPGPCLDMDATLAELQWVADHGFSAVGLPALGIDPDLPPLHDEYYEPFWARCADLGLVLFIHAGWGHEQGCLMKFAAEFFGKVQGEGIGELMGQVQTMSPAEIATLVGSLDLGSMMQMIDPAMLEALSAEGSPFDLDMGPRRVMWKLMLSGVFDRYPELEFVFTELRADWLPPTLALLDAKFERAGRSLKLRPSEYWARQGWITPSAVHTCEVAMRGDLGMEKMLFGVDFPHPESTWPNTLDWIRHNFGAVPEDEARQILGGRAVDLFGFDRTVLTAVAERIGPKPEEVLGHFSVDGQLLEAFHARAGMSRGPEEIDTPLLESLIDEDLSGISPR